MKKIFILTGEASGDKLASTVIKKIQKENNDVKFLSVGGSNLASLGISSIFNIEQITYMGFTSVLFNIFRIKRKIDFKKNKKKKKKIPYFRFLKKKYFQRRLEFIQY